VGVVSDLHPAAAQIADEALTAFVDALRRRDLTAAGNCFAADAALYGSEAGEFVRGAEALREFFEGLFAQPVTFGWQWSAPVADGRSGVVWFVADATLDLRGPNAPGPLPYRLSGVLTSSDDGRWVFALFNGAEPVSPGRG
jgi:ketosteroid isomerase-like protein